MYHGVPKAVHSDQGTEFESASLKATMTLPALTDFIVEIGGLFVELPRISPFTVIATLIALHFV